MPPALGSIVYAQAQDRWVSRNLRQYTPQSIEHTLRGAFSGNLVDQWELFDLMEGTWSRLATNLNKLKRAVIALNWKVEAWAEEGQAPSAEAERRAQFVEGVLWKMRPRATENESGFEDTMYDILDSWGKGIAVLEIEWEMRDKVSGAGSGVSIAPRCTRWVHPSYYGYPADGDGLRLNATAISRGNPQWPAAQTWTEFPENKFLISICKSKSGHPSGSALLRVLAWWWCASNFSADWLLNLAQIFGLPIRWAQHDPQASQATVLAICNALENMGSAGWAAFPAGTQLELKEPSKGAENYPQVSILDRADKQVDLLILGQTLASDTGGSGKGGGSYALGEVHKDVQDEVVITAGSAAARVVNQQFIPAILRLNFGDDSEAPEFIPEAEKAEEDPVKKAQRDQILQSLGMDFPRAWVHERHGVPLPQAGEDVVSKPVPPAPVIVGNNQPPATGDQSAQAVQAAGATEKLIDHVMEGLTGVKAQWLGGVKPFFRELVAAAQDSQLSDADFIALLEKSRNQMPELFTKLDTAAVARALEGAMGAAAVNGALRGFMRRGGTHP